jgi:hypothetical protein
VETRICIPLRNAMIKKPPRPIETSNPLKMGSDEFTVILQRKLKAAPQRPPPISKAPNKSFMDSYLQFFNNHEVVNLGFIKYHIF